MDWNDVATLVMLVVWILTLSANVFLLWRKRAQHRDMIKWAEREVRAMDKSGASE